jgi:outer membrane protein assembly factor BamA
VAQGAASRVKRERVPGLPYYQYKNLFDRLFKPEVNAQDATFAGIIRTDHIILKRVRCRIVAIAMIFVFVATGCNITRRVGDDEYMLHKNVIRIDKSQSNVKDLPFATDAMYSLLAQKPNPRFLNTFRFGVWVNSFTAKGKETRLKKWLNKKLGKPPVILDTFLIDRSKSQLHLFLNNNGFFYSDINSTIKYHKKKATVNYIITLAEPYRISRIHYKISDTAVRQVIFDDTVNSLVQRGDIYNTSKLDDERYRVASLLRNSGYYFFGPEFMYYEIDSTFANRSLVVYPNIGQFYESDDTTTAMASRRSHQKYFMNTIAVLPDFDPLLTDTARMKKLVLPAEESKQGKYIIYYRNKLRIRPSTLRNNTLLKPGGLYRERDEKDTYQQLSAFPLYGYTSIDIREAPQVTDAADSTRKFLNSMIELTRRPVQSYSLEAEGTTSGSKLGIAGNFVYQNLNLFRGGEVLTLKLTGGVEWQAGGENSTPTLLFFNTIQTGAEATLDFPKFLLPVKQENLPRVLRPRTTIKTGVNYQNRPDYERYVTNASFGYSWRYGNFSAHSLTPIEINSVSIFPDSAFLERLKTLNDPRLTNQYTDHFIMAAKYTYIFNNQRRNEVKNFTFFRWNLETSGNVLNLASEIFDKQKNENGEYTVWNIPFAQYVRTDLDFRYYFALREEHTVVYRNLFGIGIPYGNSKVLPFEKGFYAGGSNDMRGWNYRSLGPGSYKDTSGIYFEKMGDLILEANLEYRFPIYSWFKGAIFTDIGNIWLLNFSENYPGGKFDATRFLSEFAVDAGLGLRFDFSFFVFRIDGAAPLKNPAFPAGDRWRIRQLQLKDMVWNFGIGYPF